MVATVESSQCDDTPLLLLLLFSCSVVANSLWPHRLQHIRLPYPSLLPGVCSHSCPLSQWCHPTISSSVAPFSSCPQSFPESGFFPMSWLFTSGGWLFILELQHLYWPYSNFQACHRVAGLLRISWLGAGCGPGTDLCLALRWEELLGSLLPPSLLQFEMQRKKLWWLCCLWETRKHRSPSPHWILCEHRLGMCILALAAFADTSSWDVDWCGYCRSWIVPMASPKQAGTPSDP